MEKAYYVLAFYSFNPVEDPHLEVAEHKKFFENKEATSRIYISEQGINGQMSASIAVAQEYMEWMETRPCFQGLHFKIHEHNEQAFPRLTVKYRKQLVALDAEVDLSKKGKHISPLEWKTMLEKDVRPLVIDVRNDYESKVGYFEGALLPKCNTFREFKEFTDELSKTCDPGKTPVMMYCTGGIRCELFSAFMKEHGFEEIYQLNGGVINYGLEVGAKHWAGKLFVFDDRLVVPIADEKTEVVGTCHFCKSPIETYFNCANMDCNELFLACRSCYEGAGGCCSDGCLSAPRVRAFGHQHPYKPFRRMSEVRGS